MRIWILESGCRYEGGSVLGVFANEEAGLKAADVYMAERIAKTAEDPDPEDPRLTDFEKRPHELGHHYWIEHYRWAYKKDDGTFDWHDGTSEYLSLAWYELQ